MGSLRRHTLSKKGRQHMISNIRDTLIVSLLMIASLSFVENAIAGPYSGAAYQGEEFLGTYAAGICDCYAVLQHHQNQL